MKMRKEFVPNVDLLGIAANCLANLELFRPVHVPQCHRAPAPEALRRWRAGEKVPEEYQAEIREYIASVMTRTASLEDNKRRLRATMHAEAIFRKSGDARVHDLERFHVEAWKIAPGKVPVDGPDREALVCPTVQHFMDRHA